MIEQKIHELLSKILFLSEQIENLEKDNMTPLPKRPIISALIGTRTELRIKLSEILEANYKETLNNRITA